MADDLISHLKQYASEKPKTKRSDPPEIRQRTPLPQRTALARQDSASTATSDAPTVLINNRTPSQRPSQKDIKSTPRSVQSSVQTGNIISSQSAIVPTRKPVGEPSKLDKEILSVIHNRISKLTTEIYDSQGGDAIAIEDKKALDILKTALHTGKFNEQPEEIKSLYQSVKSEAQKARETPKQSSHESDTKPLELDSETGAYRY